MKERGKILKGTIVYSASNYIVMVLNIGRNLLMAGCLTPFQMGIVGTSQVFLDYCSYINLGSNFAIDKEYPGLIAKGHIAEAQQMLHSALRIILWTVIVFLSACILVDIFFLPSTSDWKALISIIAICASLQLIGLYQKTVLRARQQYNHFSLIFLLPSIVTFLVTASVIYLYTLTPSLVYVCIGAGLFVGVLAGNRWVSTSDPVLEVKQTVKFNYTRFYGLAASLLLFNLLTFINSSLDRVIGASFIDKSDFGYYVFASFVLRSAIAVPMAFETILYPAILKKHAQAADPRELFPIMQRINSVMSLLTPVLLILLLSFIPWIIGSFLPKYANSIELIVLLLPLLVFGTLPICCTDVLIAMGKQRALNIAAACSICAALIFFGGIFVTDQMSIRNIAIISLLSSLVYGALVFVLAYRQFVATGRILRDLAGYFMPMIISFLIIFVLLWGWNSSVGTGMLESQGFVFSMISCLLMLAGYTVAVRLIMPGRFRNIEELVRSLLTRSKSQSVDIFQQP